MRQQYSKYMTIGLLGVSLFARTSWAEKIPCGYIDNATQEKATKGTPLQNGGTDYNVSSASTYYFEIIPSYDENKPQVRKQCYLGFTPKACETLDNVPSCKEAMAVALDWKVKELAYNEKQEKLAKRKEDADYESRDSKGKVDDCEKSTAYGGGTFRCRPTKNLIEAAKATQQGGQLVGSTAVNMIGQKNQAKLANDFKMSSNYKAQAATSDTAMTMSSVLAMANTALAYKQAKRGKVHATNTKQLEDARSMLGTPACRSFVPKYMTLSPSTISSQVEKVQTNSQNLCQEIRSKMRPEATDDEVRSVLNRMIAEQDTTTQAARQGAFASTMNAAQSYATAVTSQILANQQRKTAKELSNTENKLNEVAETQNALEALTLNNGTYGEAAATAEDGELNTGDQTADNNSPGLDLGAPNDPTGGDALGTPPIAGAFRESKTPGGSVAGGSGLGGGGGSAPSAGNQDEGKAAYAAGFEGKDRYESAGTMVSRGGAGGGAKADSDSGMDFNSLLAQFLPKTGAEEPAAQGILEYAGGRSPASAQPEDSYLDRNADIFQRIHQTYQEKQARRQLGI